MVAMAAGPSFQDIVHALGERGGTDREREGEAPIPPLPLKRGRWAFLTGGEKMFHRYRRNAIWRWTKKRDEKENRRVSRWHKKREKWRVKGGRTPCDHGGWGGGGVGGRRDRCGSLTADVDSFFPSTWKSNSTRCLIFSSRRPPPRVPHPHSVFCPACLPMLGLSITASFLNVFIYVFFQLRVKRDISRAVVVSCEIHMQFTSQTLSWITPLGKLPSSLQCVKSITGGRRVGEARFPQYQQVFAENFFLLKGALTPPARGLGDKWIN